MRLAVLVSQYPAPSHTFIRREIDALRRRGMEVQTFSVRPPAPEEILSELDRREFAATRYVFPLSFVGLAAAHFSAIITRPSAYLVTLRASLKHRVPGLRSLGRALAYFVEGIYLSKWLRRAGVTHLHNHFANPAANVGYVCSLFLKLPWSLTLHGSADLAYPAGMLLGDKIRAAGFVACVSHYGRSQAMRTVEPEHWDKLLIVRCGVELDALPPRMRHDDRSIRFVSVGRLSPEKGQVGLVEAFAMLIAEGIDAKLRLVGDGADMERVRERIRERRLEQHCVLTGRLAEADALREIAGADVFVLASLMEGLPVVLMEALGIGVPVVAPCVAGIPELVTPERGGLLFSPGDWTGLAACMKRMAEDPPLRASLALTGRARIAAEFDVNKAVEPLYVRLRAESDACEEHDGESA